MSVETIQTTGYGGAMLTSSLVNMKREVKMDNKVYAYSNLNLECLYIHLCAIHFKLVLPYAYFENMLKILFLYEICNKGQIKSG